MITREGGMNNQYQEHETTKEVKLRTLAQPETVETLDRFAGCHQTIISKRQQTAQAIYRRPVSPPVLVQLNSQSQSHEWPRNRAFIQVKHRLPHWHARHHFRPLGPLASWSWPNFNHGEAQAR